MTESKPAQLMPGPVEPFEFLASVADKIDGFLYRCLNDKNYTMLRLTSGFDRLLDRSSAELVITCKSFSGLIHDADIEVIRGAVNRAIAQNRRWRVLYRLKHKDGSWRWVYESGGAIRDADGEVQYLDGVILDINQFQVCLDASVHDVAADLD